MGLGKVSPYFRLVSFPNIQQIIFNLFASDQMLGSGQIWIDTQGNHGFSEYWVPSIFTATLVK